MKKKKLNHLPFKKMTISRASGKLTGGDGAPTALNAQNRQTASPCTLLCDTRNPECITLLCDTRGVNCVPFTRAC